MSSAVRSTVRYTQEQASTLQPQRRNYLVIVVVFCRRHRRKRFCTDFILIMQPQMSTREETTAHTIPRIVSVEIQRVTWKVSCPQACARTPSSHESGFVQDRIVVASSKDRVSVSEGRAGSDGFRTRPEKFDFTGKAWMVSKPSPRNESCFSITERPDSCHLTVSTKEGWWPVATPEPPHEGEKLETP